MAGCGCGAPHGGLVSGPGVASTRLWSERGWWSDDRLPSAPLALAGSFVGAALGVGGSVGPDPLPGAKALLSLLPPLPKVTACLDMFGARLPPAFGLHPGELFVAAVAALQAVGGLNAAGLRRVLVQVGDAGLRGFDLRGVLDGGRPVFEPPHVPPEWLVPPQRLLDSLCAVSISKAVLELGKYKAPTSDANGISGLSTASACPGQTLQIRGAGFGASPPADTSVLVPRRGGGCTAARIISWSDTAIDVELPSDLGPGCVGFLRSGDPPPLEVVDQLAGEATRCFGPALYGWADKLRRTGLAVTPCPPCLPGNVNRLQSGGLPTISFFDASAPVVEPGTPVTLSWSTGNASSVRIQRIGTAGPWATPPQVLPGAGALALGPFAGATPVLATYQLVASNACGSASRTIAVQLSRRPALTVTGIEVVQAVQRADNSLPLTANRRTSVRVFVSSGLADGFDLGSGPNIVPGLRGQLQALDPARGLNINAGSAWNQPYAARPAPDRQLADGALHFDLPLAACSGTVQLTATVEADLPGGWHSVAHGSVQVVFTPKGRQQILPILVADGATPLPAPPLSAVAVNLVGSQRYQPFAVDGFTVNPALTMTTPSFVDLRTGIGWSLLTTMLTTAIMTGSSSGGIRCAIVPNSTAYPWGGMAIPRILVTAPSLICQASMPGVFAHELGHAYGLNHVNCGGPAGPYDGRLPLMTDEPGIDWSDRTFKDTTHNELMTYCSPDWTSTAHWNLIFNSMPI